jgi:hypothetical protein
VSNAPAPAPLGPASGREKVRVSCERCAGKSPFLRGSPTRWPEPLLCETPPRLPLTPTWASGFSRSFSQRGSL